MNQFKIITKAVDLFKKINEGEDEIYSRLKHVELLNERRLVFDNGMDYTIFDFHGNVFTETSSNRTALEHARICAYEIMLNK